MTMHRLRSALGGLAQMAAAGQMAASLGLVSSYDPDAVAVKVRIMPEDVETGWLPIKLLLAGQGWGVYAGPAVGDQALVIYQEGDPRAGVCVGFLSSDEDPPPRVLSGEIHLIAQDADALIILRPDGSVASKGTWTHEGTFHATGAVTSEADVIDFSDGASGVSMKVHRDAFNAHTHTDPQGGSVGPASPQAT